MSSSTFLYYSYRFSVFPIKLIPGHDIILMSEMDFSLLLHFINAYYRHHDRYRFGHIYFIQNHFIDLLANFNNA